MLIPSGWLSDPFTSYNLNATYAGKCITMIEFLYSFLCLGGGIPSMCAHSRQDLSSLDGLYHDHMAVTLTSMMATSGLRRRKKAKIRLAKIRLAILLWPYPLNINS